MVEEAQATLALLQEALTQVDLATEGAHELLLQLLDELARFDSTGAVTTKAKKRKTDKHYFYKDTYLVKKSDDPEHFPDERVDSALVVGLVVEAVLKLEFKPPLNTEPVPLELQEWHHHETVRICNVLVPGSKTPETVWVHTLRKDFLLGVRIARDSVTRLKASPLDSEVVVVDHPAGQPSDIVARPHRRPWKGFYHSVELKCRSVGDPVRFTWQKTLEARTLKLWTSELAAKSDVWISRILIFAELSKPVHPEVGEGSFTSHASQYLRAPGEGWRNLWGWAGFSPPLAAPPKAAPPAPKAKAKVKAAPLLTKDAQWSQLKGRLGVLGEDVATGTSWVKLSLFLQDLSVDKDANQALRYLRGAPTAKPRWKRADGDPPLEGVDFDRQPSACGGGAGHPLGPLYCRLNFLEHQFRTLYATGA
jgi:hypothetical protein